MKPFITIILFLISLVIRAQQNVGIGNINPDTSALADMTNTEKGLLIPRMTSAERKEIGSPAIGLFVYETDTQSMWSFTSSGWKNQSNAALPLDGLSLDTCVVYEYLTAQNNTSLVFNDTGTLWQSFTALKSGNLYRYSYNGSCPGMTNVEVYSGQGIGGPLLFTMPIDTVSSPGWHDLIFPDSVINVNAGLKYTVRFNGSVFWQANFNIYGGGSSSSTVLDFGFEADVKACSDHTIFKVSNDDQYLTLAHIDSIQFANCAILDGFSGDTTLRLNGAFSVSGIEDADGNTSITFENNPGQIQFATAGTTYFTMDSCKIKLTNSGQSLAIGEGAGYMMDNNTNGEVFLGFKTGYNTIGADFNTAIGQQALEANHSGKWNTVVGTLAHRTSVSVDNNSAIGAVACYNNVNGTDNAVIGSKAFKQLVYVHHNVAVGSMAFGDGSVSDSMANAVAIGFECGRATKGRGAVLLGNQAGKSRSVTNQLFIDNTDTIAPLIYGDFTQNLLRINGTLNIRDLYSLPMADGLSEQLLQSDGAGILSWENQIGAIDDQHVDTLELNSTSLHVSISKDNQPAKILDLSSLATVRSKIADANLDTDVQVEKFPDEDYIRCSVQGTEAMKITPTGAMYITGETNTQWTMMKSDPSNNANIYFMGGPTTYQFGLPGGADRLRIFETFTNAEVLSILPTGFIGMGASNPLEKLHVNGKIMATDTTRTGFILNSVDDLEDSGIAFRNNGTNYSWSIFRTDAGSDLADLVLAGGNNVTDPASLTERMRITNDGKIGIAASSPGYALQVGTNGDGTEARANAWNTFSDRRWKKDLQVIPHALEKINALHGYYYKWIDRRDTTTQVGVIAQEVEAILPEIVYTDDDGYKSVDYSKLNALLIEGMKDQDKQLDALSVNQKKMATDLEMIRSTIAERSTYSKPLPTPVANNDTPTGDVLSGVKYK